MKRGEKQHATTSVRRSRGGEVEVLTDIRALVMPVSTDVAGNLPGEAGGHIDQ